MPTDASLGGLAYALAGLDMRQECPNPSRDAPRSPDQRRLESLTPDVYPDLHEAAGKLLRRERRSHTLSPTALVHETFLRLAAQRRRVFEGKEGLLAAATGMMKRILSNYGRDRNALKRGGRRRHEALDERRTPAKPGGIDPRTVRNALERLRERDPRAAQIVEFRLYRGLTNEAIAEALGTPLRTVERDWAAARAWLRAELAEEAEEAEM